MRLVKVMPLLLLYINSSYCYAKEAEVRCATTTDARLSRDQDQGLVERHSDLPGIEVNVWSHIVMNSYKEEPVSEQTIDKQV